MMATDQAGGSSPPSDPGNEALLRLTAAAARDVLAASGTTGPAQRAMAAITTALPDADAALLFGLPGGQSSPPLWLTTAGAKQASVPGADRGIAADLLTAAATRGKTLVAGVSDEAVLPPAWQQAGVRWAAAIPLAVAGSAPGGMLVRGTNDPPNQATLAFLESIGHVVALGLTSGRSRVTDAKVADMTRLLGAVIRGQEEERARISRELHDEMNQSLTSLLVGLALLARVVESPAAQEQLVRVREQAAEALDRLRRVAQGLRPPDLEQLGLAPALESLCETFSAQHGIAARFYHVDKDCPCRSEAIDMALYRIAQEALANVARHAKATEVGVVLACREGRVTVQVEDNGNGRTPDMGEAGPQEHLGIVGMKERAALLGGKVSIESNPGRGTTVYVEIPASHGSQGGP